MYIFVFFEYSNSIGALLGDRLAAAALRAGAAARTATWRARHRGLYRPAAGGQGRVRTAPGAGFGGRAFDFGRPLCHCYRLMSARSIISRSALGLAIYSLCVVFVCSFILFEVLDIDGSDFPSTATQAVAA